MPIASSGTISIHTAAGTDRSITGEFGGSAPHALSEYYRGGANVPSSNTGVPANGTIKLSDFYGASNTTATTFVSSIDTHATNQDGPISSSYQLQVIYTNASTIRVRVFVDEAIHSTPTDGSTVFQITGAPSGYTVRRGTITDGVGGHSDSFSIIPSSSTNRIETTAKSIPTSGTELKFGQLVNSGGGFDDGESVAHNAGTCSLIFEKSGGTTFTYSYNYDIEAQNEGAGGE